MTNTKQDLWQKYKTALTKKERLAILNKLIGSLSSPSKMPCSGFSIPAVACKLGSKLNKVANSVCASCYALKGRYIFQNVQDAMFKRLGSLYESYWTDAMSDMIRDFSKGDKKYFRWHDSGDIQDLEHFDNIKQVAKNLPEKRFWLPTREFDMLKDSEADIPDNLTVRYSEHMKDRLTNKTLSKEYASIVVSSEAKAKELEVKHNRKITVCPATRKESNHKCNDCRACWLSKDIIAYLEH